MNLQTSRAKKEIVTINQNKHDYKILGLSIFLLSIVILTKQTNVVKILTVPLATYKLIDSLKAENVEGIVIDLRNNGGGSLTEAISLTGLFISKGPVVQVREQTGDTEVQTDPIQPLRMMAR